MGGNWAGPGRCHASCPLRVEFYRTGPARNVAKVPFLRFCLIGPARCLGCLPERSPWWAIGGPYCSPFWASWERADARMARYKDGHTALHYRHSCSMAALI